ncbi:MAG: hypothetical protein HYU39_05195 [Thaumarchaeota archaeon]|nr:hypothetical protein [Nitrososphaerota archaeon]
MQGLVGDRDSATTARKPRKNRAKRNEDYLNKEASLLEELQQKSKARRRTRGPYRKASPAS